MERYEKYKDSGVEWIGKVPENWEAWKLSHAFNKISSGTTPEAGADRYYENGTIYWLNTGDLNDGVLNECNKRVTSDALKDYSALKLFPKVHLQLPCMEQLLVKRAILNLRLPQIRHVAFFVKVTSLITNFFNSGLKRIKSK